MIYLFFALLLTIGLTAITILENRSPSPVWSRLNLGLAAAGCVSVLLCRILAGSMISASGQSDTWNEWARDMFFQHYSVSLPVLLVLLGILLVSWLLSLSEKRKKSVTALFLRRTVGILASCTLLLLAPLYAFTTENNIVPLETLILISGIGEALIFRLVYALEGILASRNRKQK